MQGGIPDWTLEQKRVLVENLVKYKRARGSFVSGVPGSVSWV